MPASNVPTTTTWSLKKMSLLSISALCTGTVRDVYADPDSKSKVNGHNWLLTKVKVRWKHNFVIDMLQQYELHDGIHQGCAACMRWLLSASAAAAGVASAAQCKPGS